MAIRIEEGTRRTRLSSSPLRFCILEREDLHGGSREFAFGDIECPGTSLALGMVEPVRVDIHPRIQVSVSSVRLGPVQGADQVLFTVTPSQAMVLAVLTGGSRHTAQRPPLSAARSSHASTRPGAMT